MQGKGFNRQVEIIPTPIVVVRSLLFNRSTARRPE